jgi:chromosome segregation ATPase
MKNTKVLAIILFLLSGVTIFSVVKSFFLLNEKQNLVKQLDQTNVWVISLKSQKEKLTQDLLYEQEQQKFLSGQNVQLTNNLNVTKEELSKITLELDEAKKKIEGLNSSFSVLRTENEILRSQSLNLEAQINQVSQEKDSLQAKFSSVDELKKAIKDLKRMRRVSVVKDLSLDILPLERAGRQDSRSVKKNSKNPQTAGNRGFLVLNGQSTYPARVKIEVTPIPVE